jgi:hypothetical protein
MNENDTKIVRFHNPFDFDFTPEMGAMYGGVPYFVPAGGSLLCPASLADHLGTHLARHSIINKAPLRDETEVDGKGKDRPLWNDEVIAHLKTKFVTDAYTEDKPAVRTDAEIMRARVADLNVAFPAEKEEVASAPASYKDKAEVIAELEKRGIKFNARLTKANLEKLLTA